MEQNRSEAGMRTHGWSGAGWVLSGVLGVAAVLGGGRGVCADEYVTLKHQMVAGMPDVPVYPGAKLEESSRNTEGTRVSYRAEWTTPASVKQLVAWYATALPAAGWTVQEAANPNYGDTSFVVERHGRRMTLILERENSSDRLSEITAEIPLQ